MTLAGSLGTVAEAIHEALASGVEVEAVLVGGGHLHFSGHDRAWRLQVDRTREDGSPVLREAADALREAATETKPGTNTALSEAVAIARALADALAEVADELDTEHP